MARALLKLTAILVFCSVISSCIPVPLYSDENDRKSEWVFKRLILDKASYNDVVAKLGTPTRVRFTRDKNNNVSYLICQTTGGLGTIIMLPYAYPGFVEFRGDEECWDYILEFDKDGILTDYTKSVFTGEYAISNNQIKFDVIYSMALQGYPESQWRLYNEFGRKPENTVWLCRSADNGYAKAQLYVGHIYWSASNIPDNRIKAYIWYKLAMTGDMLQGQLPDEMTQNQAVIAVQETEKVLTPEQLADADGLYADWHLGQCEQELVRGNSGG